MGQQKFSVKSQTVNMLDVKGHAVSVTTNNSAVVTCK